MINKKGQSAGLISGIVFGLAGVIIAAIIAFVITSTITGADLIDNDNTYTGTITNESLTFGALNAAKTLGAASYADNEKSRAITCNSITFAHNQTTLGQRILSGNWTQTSCSITNATALATWGNGTLYVSYTYTVTESKTKSSVNNLSANFSSGVNKISEKVPTVLLVAAIVLILSILAVLVGVWQKMRMGGGSI